MELKFVKHRKKIIKGDWNVKVGSQEILGVKGKFDPEVQN